MLISVIVPIYKVEKYLPKCIDGIIAQTYSDLEIILVDDGSPDGCPAICDGYARKDERIKVIHKENGGLASARNAGLDIASGDLIAFVDSDDWCEPDMLATMYAAYEKTHAPIVLCGAFIDWENDWKTQIQNFAAEDVVLSREQALRQFFAGNLTAWAGNKVYEKKLWEGLRYPKQIYEDIPVFRSLLTRIGKISIVAKPLYHYIQRGKSLSVSWNENAYEAYLRELHCNMGFSAAHGGMYDDVVQPAALSVYFSVLKKIITGKNTELFTKVPFLQAQIRLRKSLIPRIGNINPLDRLLLFLISRGYPPVACFTIARPAQWIYHKLRTLPL